MSESNYGLGAVVRRRPTLEKNGGMKHCTQGNSLFSSG